MFFGEPFGTLPLGWFPTAEPPHPPSPPSPPAALRQQGFDAGPAPTLGKWYNLAFKAGPGLRRREARTGLGAEIEALATRSTPEKVVERAIERLARSEPRTEKIAFQRVAREEAEYSRLTAGLREAREARASFVAAIERESSRRLAAARLALLREEDEAMVAILTVLH